MKQTFDHTDYKRHDWHEALIEIFEKIRDDEDVPGNLKGRIVKEMMQSFYYPDATCNDCTPQKTNYPYAIEKDDDSLLATYECRTCGHIYQCWYAEDFHTLQFG